MDRLQTREERASCPHLPWLLEKLGVGSFGVGREPTGQPVKEGEPGA